MVRRHFSLYASLAMALLVANSMVLATDASECTRAYANTLAKYSQKDVFLTSLRSVYSNVCGESSKASSTSLDAGIKTLIDGVPVIGSWAAKHEVKNDSSFCKAYKLDESLYFSDYSSESEPVVAAQANYNQCLEILNRGKVIVTHSIVPGNVTFSFVKTDTQTEFSVQGVVSNNHKCIVPGDGKRLNENSVVKKDGNFTIQCTRSPTKRGEDLYYPFDSIQIGTSQGASYSVDIAEETIYGPAKQSSAKREISRLEAKTLRIDALEKQIKEDKIEYYGFWITSGPRGLDGAFGQKWAWGEINGKAQNEWEALAKKRYCPNAFKVVGKLVREQPGNCCGNRQYLVMCSFANPDAGI